MLSKTIRALASCIGRGTGRLAASKARPEGGDWPDAAAVSFDILVMRGACRILHCAFVAAMLVTTARAAEWPIAPATTASAQSRPALSAAGSAGWLALWTEYHGDTSTPDLYVSSVSRDGRSAPGGTRIAGQVHRVGAAAAWNGQAHLVVWYTLAETWSVWAQRFTAAAVPLDPQPVLIDSAVPGPTAYYGTGPRGAPAVASDGTDWLIVYEAPDGSGDLRSRVVQADASSDAWSTIARGNRGVNGWPDGLHHITPAVVFDGSNYVMAWSRLTIVPCIQFECADAFGDVFAARVTRSGETLDTTGGVLISGNTDSERRARAPNLRSRGEISVATGPEATIVVWMSRILPWLGELRAIAIPRGAAIPSLGAAEPGLAIATAADVTATATAWTGTSFFVLWSSVDYPRGEVHRAFVDQTATLATAVTLLFAYRDDWTAREPVRVPLTTTDGTLFAIYARVPDDAPSIYSSRLFVRDVSSAPARRRAAAK